MSPEYQTLSDRLASGPLSLADAVRILMPIAEGLDRAHANGVFPHNLRPEKVRLDEQGSVSLVGTYLEAGAPEYMSPEQVREQTLDGRADVYSLAALAYKMLTGHPPFEGVTEQGIMYKQATEPPRPPRVLRPELPEGIDAVLLKALEKQPDDRYWTAAEFVHALSDAGAEEGGQESAHLGGAAAEAPRPDAYRVPSLQVPVRNAQEETARAVTPPDWQAAELKKRGIGRWLFVGGGIFALCLYAWLVAALSPRPQFGYAPAARVPTRVAVTLKPTSAPVGDIWFWSADYSPDGKQIVTTHDDKTVRAWDAATGKQIGVQPAKGDIYQAVYSPDGTRILTTDGGSGADDYSAGVWDETLEKQVMRLSGHSSLLFDARYNPQGTQIVTASEDGTARVWDAATGKQMLSLGDHDYWILGAHFSPDGKQIAVEGEKHNAEIYDSTTGKFLQSLWAWRVGYSPDSKRIVTTGDDNSASVLDTTTWRSEILLMRHSAPLWSAVYSPDGTQILTGSGDTTARIWDSQTGKELAVLGSHTRGVSTAIYSADGRFIVTATLSDPAQVWDAKTGARLAVLGPVGDGVDVAAFSRDGKQLFTGNEDGTARVWDTATWQELISWDTGVVAATPEPLLATATAQAAQALLTTTSEWRTVLTDYFDGNANHWTVGTYETAMGRMSKDIAGGKYTWTLNAKQSLVSRDIPTISTASNYVVGVEGRHVNGPTTCGYGVSLRDDNQSLYLFVVNDDRTWRFGRAETYLPLTVLAKGSTSAIKPGEANRVQVVARSETYTLFVNGEFVGEVSAAEPEGKSVGIGVGLEKAGDVCEFEFDNFSVRAP